MDRFCVKSRAHFSDRLDGVKLPLWRALMVRIHLAICPQCKRVGRSLEATRGALRELRDRDPDPE